MRYSTIAATVALATVLTGCAIPRPSMAQSWVSTSGIPSDASHDQAACIDEAVANTQPMTVGDSTPVFTLRMDLRRQEHVQRCMGERGWKPARTP